MIKIQNFQVFLLLAFLKSVFPFQNCENRDFATLRLSNDQYFKAKNDSNFDFKFELAREKNNMTNSNWQIDYILDFQPKMKSRESEDQNQVKISLKPIKEKGSRPIQSLSVSLTVQSVSSPILDDQEEEIYTEQDIMSIDQFWNQKVTI